MYLFFDTETTGLPDKRLPLNDPAQPRIVQLAAMLTDDVGRLKGEINLLIKPEGGWTVPEAATAIHGITTADCEAFGVQRDLALMAFGQLKNRAHALVAHNLDFDKTLVEIAWPGFFKAYEGQFFCTMLETQGICKIPSRRSSGYKWPSLQEAYQHFFKEPFQGAHDAMADVRACMRIFFGLKKLQVA